MALTFSLSFFLYPFHHLNCHCHLLSEKKKISGWVGSLVMQHSTPKNKNKIKNSRFIFRKALRKRKEKKGQVKSNQKIFSFFFNTAEERKWSFSPPLSLSLHPFRLLSSTHTHGNKTFVTNEIRVSPSFSLFFLFFFRERSFHFHFPLFCAVIIMVGATFIWPGVRFSLYSTLTK